MPGMEEGLEPGLYGLLEGGSWRWPPMRIGHRRTVNENFSLETLATRPAMFKIIPALAVTRLLDKVKDRAERHPSMGRSLLEGNVNTKQRSSHNAWLLYDQDSRLRELFALTADLLKVDPGYRDEGTGGFEESMQVLRYDVNEHYDAHRDYWDPRQFPDKQRWRSPEGFWQNRFATVLWYLQAPHPSWLDPNATAVASGGETWFPRARGGPPPYGQWEACDDRGIKVPPTEPVLFYSLLAHGGLDEYSWHCGCRLTQKAAQPKFAGNTWLWNTPSRALLDSWRRSLHRHDEA